MAGTAAGAAKARATRAAGVQAPEQVKTVERPQDEAQKRLEAKFGRRTAASAVPPTHYVVVGRDLQWEGLTLKAGETVPGAETWPRLEAWVRARRIAPAYGERMENQEPVEAGEPEELPEFVADAPEDDDPLEHTGEPLEDEEQA